MLGGMPWPEDEVLGGCDEVDGVDLIFGWAACARKDVVKKRGLEWESSARTDRGRRRGRRG